MAEQLIYHAETEPGANPWPGILAGAAAGGAAGAFAGLVPYIGGGRSRQLLPDVYADFDAGTIRVVGAQPGTYVSNARQGLYSRQWPQVLYGQQTLLLQAMTSGVVPTGLYGDYAALAQQVAGRHVDTASANAQAGQGIPSGPIITAIGQTERGGGIPVGGWVSQANLAFQTPAARAIILGSQRGPAASAPRRARAAPARRRRRVRKATRKGTRRATRRTGGPRRLVKGSAAAKAFMTRLRKMRGKRSRSK